MVTMVTVQTRWPAASGFGSYVRRRDSCRGSSFSRLNDDNYDGDDDDDDDNDDDERARMAEGW